MRLIDADALEQEFTGCVEECACCTYSDEHLGIDKCRCKLITNAKTINEWISVKDRLPEEERHVLVWVKDGYSLIDWTFNGQWQVNPYMRNDITHWMPLPEPPKEETDAHNSV